ncbi:MAG: hypothetical protein GX075_10165 [Firmicutes bacterium]|nr:hypothetical protein [Bacillota bacterium]
MVKRFKDMRLWLISLVFLGTLVLLFGGRELAVKLRAEDPTRREIESIKEVCDFSVKQKPNGLTVELKLDKVANLESILNLIKQKVESNYRQPVRQFKISGQPNSKLRQIHYDISFYLEEALVSGRYIQLKRALDSYQSVTARVYLGTEFIYIQLEDGDHYLYEAIPRRSQIVAVGNNRGGDSG